MRAKEVHEMTNDELVSKLDALKEELFNLRFRHATGQLENPTVLRTVKKEWVFFNESSAKAFLENNQAIQDACEDAKWWLTNYLKKNKE